MILLILIRCVSSSHTHLHIGETVSAEISDSWIFYELKYDIESLDAFSRITLSVQQHSTLVLSLSKTSPPMFFASNTRVEADFVDYNSWIAGSSLSSIAISTSYLDSSESIILGVGNPSLENTNISYSLIVENSKDPLCAKDCSGKGECSMSDCKCEQNFINYDCSTPAKYIENNIWEVFNVGIGDTKYVYFPFKLATVDIDLRWIGPQHVVTLDWSNNGLFELPNLQENYQLYNMPRENKEIQITISESKGKYLYLGIFNNDVQSNELLEMSIKITYIKDASSFLFMTIIIFVVLVVLIFWIGSYLVRLMIRRNRQRLRVRTATTNNEMIELLSPRMPYHEIRGASEEQCVICLDDYTQRDSVRQLQCGHVFHSRCIDEWLKFNKTCCLCKDECMGHMHDLITTVRQPI